MRHPRGFRRQRKIFHKGVTLLREAGWVGPRVWAPWGPPKRHALVIEHQLRPLFSFFQSLTLPIGVYATPEEIQDGEVTSSALQQHIQRTVDLAVPVLHSIQARLPLQNTVLEAQAA